MLFFGVCFLSYSRFKVHFFVFYMIFLCLIRAGISGKKFLSIIRAQMIRGDNITHFYLIDIFKSNGQNVEFWWHLQLLSPKNRVFYYH